MHQRTRQWISMFLLVVGLGAPTAGQTADIPVFPGAKGPGAETPGGRGGVVIKVTNLDDSGPGSLRAAVNADGPRIVVFRVGGVIQLQSNLEIDDPHIYIAGQTAPGGGIVLNDKTGPEQTTGILRLKTHDVVIRFLRFRSGLGQAGGADNVTIAGPNRDIVIDHCSFSWANDEAIGIWENNQSIQDVTISWNILAEALEHHSTGLLVGGRAKDQIEGIGIHHNFFMSNSHRNPWVKNESAEVINNLVYNWEFFGLAFSDGQTIDIIGNKYRRGPTTGGRPAILYSRSTSSFEVQGVDGDPSIYIAGNVSDSHPDPSADNWEMIKDAEGWSPTGNAPPRDTRRNAPLGGGKFPIAPEPIDQMESRLLEDAGAAYRLDAHGDWIPNRDAVDRRLVQAYRDGGGAIPEDEQEAGGVPDIASGSPYEEADGDGMADLWEDDHGLDPADPQDGGDDADGDGYTNIEEFLNGSDPTEQTGQTDGAVGLDEAERETRFSEVETFGDRDNYEENTPARWRVLSDRGDLRYGLTTTAFQGDDGRLGEYSIVPDKTYGDVEVTAQVRSTEDFSANGGADYVVILGYQDADNYYYAMFNRSPDSSGLYRFDNGERTELAVVEDRVIADNDYHEVTFSREGDQLTMAMDGQPLAEATDATLGDGAVGVGAFNDSAYFDDIRVDTPDSDSGADAGGTGDAGSGDAGRDGGGLSDTGGSEDGTSGMADAGDDGTAEAGTTELPEGAGCSCSPRGSGSPIGWLAVAMLGLVGLRGRNS